MKVIYFEKKLDAKGTEFEKALKAWKPKVFPAILLIHKDRILPVAWNLKKKKKYGFVSVKKQRPLHSVMVVIIIN